MWVRTKSTLGMVGSFIFVIYMGHVPLMFMIFAIQATMCRELFKLAREGQQQRQSHHQQRPRRRRPVVGTRFQQWYFFFAAAFWLYLRFVQKNLLVEITSNARLARVFGWLLRRHSFASYSLYTAGIINFVLSLERGYYLYQFGQFAWTHMILLVVFIPTSFFVSNIFDGLIWFLLPCALVIINDISAYLTGFFFGRTPLIKLSPKKTWEGFIGGLLLTLVASWYLARYMSRFPWMVCERNDLSMGWLRCDPDTIFKDHVYTTAAAARLLSSPLVERLTALGRLLPPALAAWLWNLRIVAAPMQLHALMLSLFASVIAPFGGFFASGFKRGFKIKDFGDSIPGHGGMTDRMDCQVVMAVFAYLYFNNVVARQTVTVGYMLQKALQLDGVHMLELFTKLGNMLVGEEVLPERFSDDFARLLRTYQVPLKDAFPSPI